MTSTTRALRYDNLRAYPIEPIDRSTNRAALHTRARFDPLFVDYRQVSCMPSFVASMWNGKMSIVILSLVTLARPSTSSSLRITDRSFQYASPRLWNQLPAPLRQPLTNLIIIGIPSLTHSFTLGLNPSFSANPPYRSLSFFSFRFHYISQTVYC